MTERLRSERFDPTRPPWRIWLLPGQPDGRVAMVVKLHHAIADGVAAMRTISAFLDTEPDAPLAAAPPWTPAPAPSDRDLLTDAFRRHLRTREALHGHWSGRLPRAPCPHGLAVIRELLAEEPWHRVRAASGRSAASTARCASMTSDLPFRRGLPRFSCLISTLGRHATAGARDSPTP